MLARLVLSMGSKLVFTPSNIKHDIRTIHNDSRISERYRNNIRLIREALAEPFTAGGLAALDPPSVACCPSPGGWSSATPEVLQTLQEIAFGAVAGEGRR